MRLGQEAAGCVDRQRAARADAAVLHERRRLAGAAIAEALEREQHQRRERIVGVEALHVVARDALA